MSSSIASEILKLEPSSVIELFEFDMTSLGGSTFHFHAGTNSLASDIIWQGVSYIRFPIEMTGFSFSGNDFPRPKLKCSNFMSTVTSLLLEFNNFLGTKVSRKRTLRKYLDSQNFPEENLGADPTAFFPDDVYYIDRKVSENRESVEFELSTSFDLKGVQLPRRQIIQNICTWRYRSAECSYAGTNYFLSNDTPTLNPGLDVCGKRLSSCKCRFGANNPLPYGGFPAAGLIR